VAALRGTMLLVCAGGLAGGGGREADLISPLKQARLLLPPPDPAGKALDPPA
jgi:hypothetical protein